MPKRWTERRERLLEEEGKWEEIVFHIRKLIELSKEAGVSDDDELMVFLEKTRVDVDETLGIISCMLA